MPMINPNFLGSVDDVSSFNSYSSEPYYRLYERFADPVTTVVCTPYKVLEAYTTTKTNPEKGFSTDTLNLALLIPPVANLTTKESFIRLKLRGATVSTADGKLLHTPSTEFSSFVQLGMYFKPDFLLNPKTLTMKSGDWQEERTYYNNMVGLEGLMAFSTTSEFKGHYSYGAVFFVQGAPNCAPMSAYEFLALKQNYRQGLGDYATLMNLLQARTNELFGVETALPNGEQESKPTLAQQGATSFASAQEPQQTSPYEALKPKSNDDDDDIPF